MQTADYPSNSPLQNPQAAAEPISHASVSPAPLTSDPDVASGPIDPALFDTVATQDDAKEDASRDQNAQDISKAVEKSKEDVLAKSDPVPSPPSTGRSGHTLRRRARVDYNVEHGDSGSDSQSSPASRIKKRRSDNSIDQDATYKSDAAGRRASLDGNHPSSTRRRNPSRKSSGMLSYTEPDDEVEEDIQVKSASETDAPAPDADADADEAAATRSTYSDPGSGKVDFSKSIEDASNDHNSSASKSDDGMVRLIDDGEVRLIDEASSDSVAGDASVGEPADDASNDAAEQLQMEANVATADSTGDRDPAAHAANENMDVEMEDADGDAEPAVGHTSPEPTDQGPKKEESAPLEMEDIQNTPLDAKEEDKAMAQVPELTLSKASPSTDRLSADIKTDSEPKKEADLAPPKAVTKHSLAPSPIVFKAQPVPEGRWAHLTPYLEGEFVTYPEKKEATPEEEGTPEEGTPAEGDANDAEQGEENDDATDAAAAEFATPALNTPTRGSPVPDSVDPTATNSPAPGLDDADDDVSDSQEDLERIRYYRYRKLRDPEEYISAIENYEDMPTAELYELLEAINLSLGEWQSEWSDLGKVVDDYENALRRRLADSKYESRTRNLGQHGVNWEEPEFVVKGYRAKDRDTITETRYLQSQDRIMAATYGFEYDPHPSKIGRQNPEGQQFGVVTRGRSLRNQPRQSAKATEADEVTGKRLRKPVQLFDPAQEISRSSTPVPARARRRRGGDDDNVTSSFNSELPSDVEETPSRTRRRRTAARPKTSMPGAADDEGPYQDTPAADDANRLGRRARARPAIRYDEGYDDADEDSQPETKHPRRHLLTLKLPRNKSGPGSAISDNGDSRPSTADSDSSSHTAESSYSFRPKRQKRFREEMEDAEGSTGQAPPKKRGKRVGEEPVAVGGYVSVDSSQPNSARKPQKIKVVRNNNSNNNNNTSTTAANSNAATTPVSRNGTPSSTGNADGEEPRKDYKLMTKSEKMSASMKSKSTPSTVHYTFSPLTCILKVVGQMVTWLAPLRSARLPLLLKRLLRLLLTRRRDRLHPSLMPAVTMPLLLLLTPTRRSQSRRIHPRNRRLLLSLLILPR